MLLERKAELQELISRYNEILTDIEDCLQRIDSSNFKEVSKILLLLGEQKGLVFSDIESVRRSINMLELSAELSNRF